MKSAILVVIGIPLLVLAVLLLPLAANARLLTIKYPNGNATVPAGKFISINGTSAPSNSTHTQCNVKLQINQNGYKPVTPQGMGVANYTKWSTISTEMLKVGHNEIEGQLMCFAQGIVGNATVPNLIKHLTHNVTAQ